MTINLTLAEATAVYKALEQKIALLQQDSRHISSDIARLTQISQKIENAILSE